MLGKKINQLTKEEQKLKDGGNMNAPTCVRCGRATNGVTTMSMFNEDIICMPCKDNERTHPNYKKAVDADNEAIKGGNYNFKGIGMKDGGNTPSVVLKPMSNNTAMWRINSVELVKSENGKYYWVALDSKREVVTKGENEFNTPSEAQADFQATKLENGGGLKKNDSDDISQYYDSEFALGTFVPNIKQKQIITEKIGLNEQNADYFIEMSPKFAVWLADIIVKDEIRDYKVGLEAGVQVEATEPQIKQYVLNKINERNNWISTNYSRGIRRILDWLMHPLTPKQNLRELNFLDAFNKSEIWHEELKTLGGDVDYVEPEENEIIKRYPKTPEGAEYYWVLIPSSFCSVESARMGHCGRTGASSLISLRSIVPYGKGHTLTDSHVTIAWDEDEALFYQVKGKKNQKPSQKYHDYIFDLIKDFAKDEDHKFKGFGVEYDPKEDYGFEDMSKEQVLELYKINKHIFNDFEGECLLFDLGITDKKPNTKFTITKQAENVEDLVHISKDIHKDFIYQVLSGEDTHEWFDGSWSYYYENYGDLVNNLDAQNEVRVIDEIVNITKLSKEEVIENGALYYLNGEDENFEKDLFDNIVRAMVSATVQAEEQDYMDYYKRQITNALEDLGVVVKLDWEGVTLQVNVADHLSNKQISNYIKNLDTHSNNIQDAFFEALSDGTIDTPVVTIDERYSAYAGDKEFNAILKEISLQDGYKLGGITKK